MKHLLKNILYLIIGLIFLFSFSRNSQNIDVNILKGLNPRYPSSQYWAQTSNSAYWVPAGYIGGTLVYGLIKNEKKDKINACEAFVSVASAITATEILKRLINRTRPADTYSDDIFVNSATHGRSFPSGHATLAFSTATTISLQYKKWYIVVPAYLWAVSEGYSRMYLGKHYPSDVIAGAAIGAGGAYLSHWLTKKVINKKYK